VLITLTTAAQHGSGIDGDLAARVVLDLASVLALAHGLFLPRHSRRDLVTVFLLFDAALFCVLVIGSGRIGTGAGLGLFAVLFIVRLRSERYRNVEIGYFFVTLTLSLVNRLAPGLLLPLLLDLGLLAVVAVIDLERLLPVTVRTQAVLDTVRHGQELVDELSFRLGARVLAASVGQIDYERHVMTVDVESQGATASSSSSSWSLR